jgi:rRNA maturation endonuclease Nob1
MDHLPRATKCKHKITVEDQKLICAYCGEPIKL